MSIIFADTSAMVAAASKLARANAEFEAAQTLCAKIMMPKHAAVMKANDEFKAACNKVTEDEKGHIFVDLNMELHCAEQNEQEELARQREAAQKLLKDQLLAAANATNGSGSPLNS